MMINTDEHAYNTETFLLNNWYIYVSFMLLFEYETNIITVLLRGLYLIF